MLALTLSMNNVPTPIISKCFIIHGRDGQLNAIRGTILNVRKSSGPENNMKQKNKNLMLTISL